MPTLYDLPTIRAPMSIDFAGIANVGVNASPYNFVQQATENPGQIWHWDVTYGPMTRRIAEQLIGFKLSLNGRANPFLMGDPSAQTPLGSWNLASSAGGVVKVKGAGQSGRTLKVTGLEGAAIDDLLVASGDYIQIGSALETQLYKCTSNKTALDLNSLDGNSLILDIWPRLRTTPAHNAVVYVNNTKGIWRMSSNIMDWSIQSMQYGFSFRCDEYKV